MNATTSSTIETRTIRSRYVPGVADDGVDDMSAPIPSVQVGARERASVESGPHEACQAGIRRSSVCERCPPVLRAKRPIRVLHRALGAPDGYFTVSRSGPSHNR